jgi:hypothetical protein
MQECSKYSQFAISLLTAERQRNRNQQKPVEAQPEDGSDAE